MLSSVRMKAGLGSPPMPYTANRNESMNKVVKVSTDYQKLSWVQLIDKMFNLINSQIKEIEKPVIGMGEYRFKPSYRCLELSRGKWFTMSSHQQEKHLNKVFQKSCVPTESSLLCNEPRSSGIKDVRISPENSGITNLSAEQLEHMWEKAKKKC